MALFISCKRYSILTEGQTIETEQLELGKTEEVNGD